MKKLDYLLDIPTSSDVLTVIYVLADTYLTGEMVHELYAPAQKEISPLITLMKYFESGELDLIAGSGADYMASGSLLFLNAIMSATTGKAMDLIDVYRLLVVLANQVILMSGEGSALTNGVRSYMFGVRDRMIEIMEKEVEEAAVALNELKNIQKVAEELSVNEEVYPLPIEPVEPEELPEVETEEEGE